MNMTGMNQSAFGMSPAHQRLGATAFLTLNVDDSLIVKLEFVALYGLAQVVFKLSALPRICFQGDIKQTISISAVGFGLVEGTVGIFDERVGVRSVLRRRCNADACTD